MRIFYNAVNGRGLGHMMRVSAIATAVPSMAPLVHQLILTGSNYPQHFSRVNASWMVTPLAGFLDDGKARYYSRSVSSEVIERVILAALEIYSADVAVFDTYVRHQMINSIKALDLNTAIVFRQCREALLRRYLASGVFSATDRIIIPHDRSEFCAGLTSATTKALEHLHPKIDYVGPIVFPMVNERKLHVACESLRLSPQDLVILITCGGGGYDFYAAEFVHTAVVAAKRIQEQSSATKIVVVGGPFSGCEDRVRDAGVMFLPEYADLQLLISRADLVIAHGGYNTVNEIQAAGTRALLVPVARYTEDQEKRIKGLARAGRVGFLKADSSSTAFERAIRSQLANPKFPKRRFKGADRAARSIVRLAGGCTVVDDALPSGELLRAVRRARLSNYVVARVRWSNVRNVIAKLIGASVDPATVWWQIYLGRVGREDLRKHASEAISQLARVPTSRRFLWFKATSGETQLPAVLASLTNLQFGAIVAQVPRQITTGANSGYRTLLDDLRRSRRDLMIDIISDDCESPIWNRP